MTFYKRLLLLASAVSLVFLLAAAARENFFTEWRHWQRAYLRVAGERAESPAERARVARFEVKPRQLFIPELNTIDRCVSCHVGIEDPHLAGQRQPLAPHSGDYLRAHPPEKFGCTICHRGQGRATSFREAKATDVFWDTPLLPARYTQASCGLCHDPAALGKKGAPTLARGVALFDELQCRACHRLNGLGGGLSLALDGQGGYPKHHYPMAAVTASPGEASKTTIDWLEQHFRDPQAVVPGSTMTTRGLGPAEVLALTTYMLSLRGQQPVGGPWTAPDRYRAIADGFGTRGQGGATLFSRLCRACHGEATFGTWNNQFQRFVPAILSPAYLARARLPYLKTNILKGRPGTLMAGFDGGLRPDDVDRLLGFVTAAAPPEAARSTIAQGVAATTATLFADLCAGCHGSRGEGLIAPQLLNPVFQQSADDGFIAATIREGRPRTAMPSFAPRDGVGLREPEVRDLVAFIRTLGASKGQDHGN